MGKKQLCSRSRLNIVLLPFFLCSFQQPEPLRQGSSSAAAFLISIADFRISSKVLKAFSCRLHCAVGCGGCAFGRNAL